MLDTAAGIFSRIRAAHERQKHISTVIDSHKEEVSSITNIISIVREEKALQTASVVSELINIETIGQKLVRSLQTLEKSKGNIHQLAYQLVHGANNEKTLAAIMAKLAHVKGNLSLKIQVANVGLLRNAQDTITANATIIEEVNSKLERVLGEGRGLKIVQLLADRSVGRAYGCGYGVSSGH